MAIPLTVGGQTVQQQTQPPLPQWYGTTAPYAGTSTPYTGGNPLPNFGTLFPSDGGGGTAPPPPTPVTTQTVTAPPTQGGAFGGGADIDWASMIGGSWEVAQAEAMMAQQMARARDAFQGDLRSAFVNLGYTGDQSKLGNLSQYLDQETIQNAIQNKYSLYNQIQNQATRANAVNEATLAARGMLNSGQTSVSGSRVLQSAEQARYDALRNFLQQGSTGLTHIGDVEAQMAQGVANARMAAAQRLASMFQPTPLQIPQPGAPAPAPAPGAAGDPFVAPTWITAGDQTYVPVTNTETGEMTPWLNWGLYGAGGGP